MRSSDIQSSSLLRVTRKELTFPFLSSFYENATALIDCGVGELTIDFSDVVYIDSASLGCLMDICRIMSDRNGVVELVGLHERVRAVVTMAGLSRYIGLSGEKGINRKHRDPQTTIREKGIPR